MRETKWGRVKRIGLVLKELCVTARCSLEILIRFTEGSGFDLASSSQQSMAKAIGVVMNSLFAEVPGQGDPAAN